MEDPGILKVINVISLVPFIFAFSFNLIIPKDSEKTWVPVYHTSNKGRIRSSTKEKFTQNLNYTKIENIAR